METKNFLFLLAILLASFVGCQSVERRQNAQNPTAPVVVRPGVVGSEPVTLPPQAEGQPAAALNPATPAGTTPIPNSGQTSSHVPPVGVFLSAGAMRSFAHIGVLRALQKAHVPIVAIGGAEWGSVIAAAYAFSKTQFEAEWELMKLKQSQIPTTNLIRRQISELNPSEMAPFLKAAFADKDLERTNIAFRCPYTDGEQTQFISKGLAREQLPKCIVLPPTYSALDASGKALMSGAVDPGDWAGELRRAGAQFIIYVDVISRGQALHNSVKYSDISSMKALWHAVRTLSRAQHGFANLTIEVPMDYDLTDFDRRREAITIGEDAAKQTLNSTLKAIGMQN
jgi:predicted acylesterase/phospholipase RssA